MDFQTAVTNCFAIESREEMILAIYRLCIKAMNHTHDSRPVSFDGFEDDHLSLNRNHTVIEFNKLVERNKPLVDATQLLKQTVTREEAKAILVSKNASIVVPPATKKKSKNPSAKGKFETMLKKTKEEMDGVVVKDIIYVDEHTESELLIRDFMNEFKN